ncbi:MAG: S8 family serine peptidase [Bacillaceae bacterium]|nr:S8 family serine peptidase [Bacillaceae bacterium]
MKLSKAVVTWCMTATMVAAPVLGYAEGVKDHNGSKPEQVPQVEHLPKIQNLDGNKFFDNLEEKLSQVKSDEKLPVIVQFDSSKVNENAVEALKKRIGKFQVKYEYDIIDGMAATLTKKQIQQLEKIPFVNVVEYDSEVQATLDTSDEWFGTSKARMDFDVEGDLDGNPNSYTKDDVVIAVIDTGIDGSHVDLDDGKVIGWKDYVKGQSTPYDDNGHGTHVAGIIAGEGEGNGNYEGVASGAALVGIKVLDRNGSGSMSDVTAGIDWAVQNKDTYGIEILNLSLGTSASSDGTDSTSQAINNAVDQGLVAVVAAGNSGPGTYTIGSPGAAEKAITVGAGADVGEGGYFLADFSSRGYTADNRIKPDIVSAGYNIMAPEANSTNGYVQYSGTSMATPFTAGTIALMLDHNPSLSPSQVENHLYGTAIDWGPAGKDIDYGYGLMDGYAAVQSAGGDAGSNIDRPDHYYQSEDLPGSGYSDVFNLTVDDTDYPIAVTMIMPDWTSSWFSSDPDFDIYVYDPNGNLVAESEGTQRQETISFTPAQTGTYQIEVYSYSGDGDYFFDVSAGGNGLSVAQDDM